MDIIFHPIIVIYNQQLGETVDIESIIAEFTNSNIIIVDNSTKTIFTEENKKYCRLKELKYISMNGNQGLPKAYNAAVSMVPRSNNDYVLILDQDTVISKDMMTLYSSAIRQNQEKKIFCPVVSDSVGIMSPTLKVGKHFKHSENVDFNTEIYKYSFINSGMCINTTVFDVAKYDENLFLDMVDHDFVEQVKSSLGDVFYVITQLQVKQNFSGVTKNSYESDSVRFRILIKDQDYYYQKYYGNVTYSRKRLFLRAMKLCLIHKRLSFLYQILK